MSTYEKEGVYAVCFDEANDNGLIGKIEGESTPVFVQKGTLSPCLGEAWVCKLIEDDGPNGMIYLATLVEKVDEAVYAVDGEEQPEEEATQESVEEKEEPKEEFKIDEGEESEEKSAATKKLTFRWSHFVSYIGDNTLHTDVLKDGRYIVYASPDGKRIQFLPCKHGDFTCHEGKIRIPFLDNMVKAIDNCIIGHNEFGDAMEIRLLDLDKGE